MGAFGGSTGSMDVLSAAGLKNGFVNISSTSLESYVASEDRVQPRQVSTGNSRGSQRINNTDGSYVIIGMIPDTDNEFGIGFFDKSGKLQAKYLGATDYKYDTDTGKNYYRSGVMPDGTNDLVIVQSGDDVEDAFSL